MDNFNRSQTTPFICKFTGKTLYKTAIHPFHREQAEEYSKILSKTNRENFDKNNDAHVSFVFALQETQCYTSPVKLDMSYEGWEGEMPSDWQDVELYVKRLTDTFLSTHKQENFAYGAFQLCNGMSIPPGIQLHSVAYNN